MMEKVRDEFIEKHNLKFLRSTKYNEIYSNKDVALIWNRTNGLIKIKSNK